MIDYKAICEKLGFDPKKETPKIYHYDENEEYYEDDSQPSPFSKLTFDELCYLDREVYSKRRLARK